MGGKLGSGVWEPKWPGPEVAQQQRLQLQLLATIAGELRALVSLQPGFELVKHETAVAFERDVLLAELWHAVESTVSLE